MKYKSLEKWIPLFTLPLTLAVCFALWIIMSNNTYTEIYGENGVWDLRSFDFENESARVLGDVEFIPDALLTPEEFEARADEIQVGRPEDVCEYSTSRIRILLPDVRLLLAAAGAFLLCMLMLHREHQEPVQNTAPAGYEQAAVVYVIDGDTMIVRRDGMEAEERVRLIGMDCEESALGDESLNTEKGREAAAFTRSLLPEGTVVYLQKDVSETDRYNRLLRYVWLELPEDPADEKELREKMLNAILLEQDMAEPMDVAPDLLYSDVLHKISKY